MPFFKKSSKFAAYEALIKYQITSLPVPLQYHTEKIQIFTLQLLAAYHRQSVEKYYKVWGKRGFVVYSREDDRYIIFLNANDSQALQRWCISAAIGYIESGMVHPRHGVSLSHLNRYIRDFAYVYTCPDCILLQENVRSFEQILDVCQIPYQKAYEKSKRIGTVPLLYDEKVSHIEKQVCELFQKDKLTL